MDFVAVVDQVIALLCQRRRVAYRTLQRHFQLDDEALEDLKMELIDAQHLACDEQGRILVWLGVPEAPPSPPPRHADGCDATAAERRLEALPPGVMALLRQERRVTYRTLTAVFGLDEPCLEAVRHELGFKRLARDEDSEGLVWTGEAPRCSRWSGPPPPACSSRRRRRPVPSGA